jgi:hypoxanthine phosphoribosyltransferase
VTGSRPRPAFAHASEAELARILDFYEVTWEYEPHTFPIRYDLEGAVLESFTPDFYLPDLELYVEITTLKQRLVRKKNRKLRRLRELYPGVRAKLLYARDFRALLLKYGRITLADALSGSVGQATPPRRVASAGRGEAPLPAGAPGPAKAEPAPAARSRRTRRSRAQVRARAAASGAGAVHAAEVSA